MAEDSANRTHQRLSQPPNGFEDRPEHQLGLPSATIVAAEAVRGCGSQDEKATLSESSSSSAFPGRLKVGQRPLEP